MAPTHAAPAAPSTKEQRANQRNAVLAGFLGWTLDAFDFFILTLVIDDVAHAFGRTRPDIALAITLTLAMRPVGAVVFGLMADRFGRRLPLMLNVIFYAVISVLSGLAPSYGCSSVLRHAVRHRHGRRVGRRRVAGARIGVAAAARPAVGPAAGRLRDRQPARGARVPHWSIRTSTRSYPGNGWRVMFFLGGLPALLSLFIRSKVKESEAWHEHRTDWTTLPPLAARSTGRASSISSC